MKFINSKGVTWYLHRRPIVLPRNKVKSFAYTFKREKGEDYLEELPYHLEIFENPNGYPMCRRIGKK